MSNVEEPVPNPNTGEVVQLLTEEARRLADDVSGSLSRVRLHVEDASVELEWDAAAVTPDGPAPPAVITAVSAAPPDAAGEPARVVRSPMVGTFYHAPAPEDPPFVSVGGRVEAGTVVGIIEAMKLMNEITADETGVVREILVPNGTPVEFEQPLIALEPLPDEG